MFNGIKRYKTRFAGAVSIFGIAAFLILFCWKSNFGSAHNLSTTTLDSALEWSFEPERKLESGSFRISEKSNELFLVDDFREKPENWKSGYEDKQLRNVLSDFLKESEFKKENNTTLDPEITKIKKTKEESKEFKNLKPEKPASTNPSEAAGNPELVTNSNDDSSNTKIQDMWELPQEETHSTNDLEITGAWEASAELSVIEEAEIRNREKVTNLERERGFSDLQVKSGSEKNGIETGNENEKKSAIKRQIEPNHLLKSDFLNRNPVTVSADFSNQQSEKETIDRVSHPNPDGVLKTKISKSNRRDKLTQLYIQEVERYLNRNEDGLSGGAIARKKDVLNIPEFFSEEYSKVVIDPLEKVDLESDLRSNSLERMGRQTKPISKSQQNSIYAAINEEKSKHLQEVDFANLDRSKTIVLENGTKKDEEKFVPGELVKSNFLIRTPEEKFNLSFVSEVSHPNPDGVLKNRISTSLESKVDFDSVSWEMESDTFEIRILENIHIESWAWNHIREKLDEIKNKTFKSNAPSLFASGKEMLLYFPRRDESRRKSRPNPNKQDFVFENPGNVRKDSNSLILIHSLEVPNINRKQMRYYAIRTNGPPPTDHKQV
ncbi:hypothetical protein LEP1GSC036_1049 [Leptospira weilii str. 2006001853]|uniref:Uncharacterized protein n=1 Tax=Leptospira weilii str. 2006001853 TaxID=1001589 RepID=A0A828Z199_9LEPT|nr:hypothetical protein [Leptospira weilii]EKR63751.1 hypothetical protein LEP1GSC036_1049 [Leptospira weilii str. 2006001853]